MNTKRYEEIRDFIEGLSKEEFYSMVVAANEKLDFNGSYTLELTNVYSSKSKLNNTLGSSLDLYKLDEMIEAA